MKSKTTLCIYVIRVGNITQIVMQKTQILHLVMVLEMTTSALAGSICQSWNTILTAVVSNDKDGEKE